MLDELQNWWQNLSPETLEHLKGCGVALAALLGGHFLGKLVTRALRARNFDAALCLPTSGSPTAEAAHGFTPTFFAGLLVRLTVWALAARWLAHQYGWMEAANALALIMPRIWALATVLVAALALGGMLARRLIEVLQSFSPAGSAPSSRAATIHRALAGAVAAGAYVLVALLALLVAADLFGWPLTRDSALALWQFAQHLLIAGTALFLGLAGAHWARDLGTPESTTSSPEKRAGQYTAMGIMAATTVLAVAVLLSSAGVLIGLAALAVVGLLLWLARGYLPDVIAGLQLRTHKVHEVWWEGAPWRLAEIGLLWTEVSRAGEFCRLQNRTILDARMHGAPAATVQR
jgi:hypothetical protein